MKLLVAPALLLGFLGSAKAQLAPPDEHGMSMGHVHLNTRDVEAQRKFWTVMFDAVPLKRAGLDGVKTNGVLILFTKQDPTAGTVGGSIDHFGYKVRSLPEFIKRAHANGYPIPREFTGSEGFPNCYITAPDDVKIELQEDTTLTQWVVFQHLHYMIKDPKATQAWYVKTFGFDTTQRSTHVSANVPGANLSLDPLRNSPETVAIKGRAMDHIGFEVKNLEAFCKKLEANGVKFDIPYRKVPSAGIADAFLTDPNGAYIELTEGLDQY
jgi:catechol 2,3-dioxygenase-like lactoylglutathione lyase family enzyme